MKLSLPSLSLSSSRNSAFREPEGSSCSQEHATPKPDPSRRPPPPKKKKLCFLKTHFNIIIRLWDLRFLRGGRCCTSVLKMEAVRCSETLVSTYLQDVYTALQPTRPTSTLSSLLRLGKHFSSPHVCYMPTNTIFHELIILIFGEVDKLWNSSLRSFLQPPVTSSLLRPNIFPSTLFSDTLNVFFPKCEKLSFTPIQNNR
jgi:hypothetical protein